MEVGGVCVCTALLLKVLHLLLGVEKIFMEVGVGLYGVVVDWLLPPGERKISVEIGCVGGRPFITTLHLLILLGTLPSPPPLRLFAFCLLFLLCHSPTSVFNLLFLFVVHPSIPYLALFQI